MCNVGVFYFIVKNLPNAVNSCFANVHLVALCYVTLGSFLCLYLSHDKIKIFFSFSGLRMHLLGQLF